MRNKRPYNQGSVSDFLSYHADFMCTLEVSWTDKKLVKVTRLKLHSQGEDKPWSVMYCYGELKGGMKCKVYLPFSELQKTVINKIIQAYGVRDHVNVEKLGILDSIIT